MPRLQLDTSLPPLAIGEYRLFFRYQPPSRLPHYPGFAWRGAFGLALKAAVCVVRSGACDACLLRYGCAYSLIFETPPPPQATKMRRYERIPHPFALRIDGAYGDSASSESREDTAGFRLGFHLFGQANRQLPYVIHAFGKAGERGIGATRQPFYLSHVEQRGAEGGWHCIYQVPAGQLDYSVRPASIQPPPAPSRIRIELLTPFRSKTDGALVTLATFAFRHWFGPLLRRISMLSTFHGGQPWEADFAGLMHRAGAVALDNVQLSWHHLTRYSSRHGKTLEMGGLLGGFELSGEDLLSFWPLLWLGQWTSAGKGASMGLGAYRIAAASLSEQTPAQVVAHSGEAICALIEEPQ
ncbi:MAG: CRISPR system precrRNA processing endoribonuclease RAMP protein Cas6 [Methylococcaceae bacterium]|nr:MAG: CRISPR system precrRNA processing endoribonuclease RAMP protein Cas6 [Methylococcaceae bacterium]